MLAEGDDHRVAVRHSLDLAFQNAELRGIDQIVSGVHCEEGRVDLLERRSRVVVLRRLDLVQHVIGIDVCVGDIGVDHAVGGSERGCFLLTQDRVATHEP